jgi:hypothetical protein
MAQWLNHPISRSLDRSILLGLPTDPNKGMAGRCIQGLIDVLEGHHGGKPADMPYVVNKEAFR